MKNQQLQRIDVVQNVGLRSGGSLPNVNQMASNNSIDLKV